ENGSISGDCRTSPKPIRWDYYLPFNTARRRLYDVYAAMNNLRKLYPNAFNRNTVTTGTSFGSNLWKTLVLNHTSLQVVVIANFNTFQNTANVTFPSNGIWYDYTTPGNLTIDVSGNSRSITLPAGGYKVYVNTLVPGGTVTDTRDIIASNGDFKLKVYPNPVQQQATLSYELPKSGQVSIQLINLQGQVVATKNMGFQLKGMQVFEINRQNFGISTLAPGQYVLQVRVDNIVRYEKIMMQQF
ncbi:MAG: T9SS type A sorting domain-containing protein, partial [Chitinophagaceae bacterium]